MCNCKHTNNLYDKSMCSITNVGTISPLNLLWCWIEAAHLVLDSMSINATLFLNWIIWNESLGPKNILIRSDSKRVFVPKEQSVTIGSSGICCWNDKLPNFAMELTKKVVNSYFFWNKQERSAWLPLLIVQGHELALGQLRTAQQHFHRKYSKLLKPTRNVKLIPKRWKQASKRWTNQQQAPRFCIMLQEIDRLFRFNELKSREYKFRFVRNLKSQKKGK